MLKGVGSRGRRSEVGGQLAADTRRRTQIKNLKSESLDAHIKAGSKEQGSKEQGSREQGSRWAGEKVGRWESGQGAGSR